MRRNLAIILCTIGLIGFGADAMARGPGGGAGIGGAGMGRDTSANPPVSTQGAANANAPWTGNQEQGLDRAQQRMSDEGLSHEKATANQDRRVPKTPSHDTQGKERR